MKICVIGLGYVGLPLAVNLARRYRVTGFDLDGGRIAELAGGKDRTGEVEAESLTASALALTSDESDLPGAEVYIVTVPTPVTGDSKPDLSAVLEACRIVGRAMRRQRDKRPIVVFESTVYPGVTEEICGPELEGASNLVCGKHFFLAYSPERINPGDREHRLESITKVVAGQTPEVAATLEEIYGSVTSGGVFVARDIRTAEAAKVIENAQRDINIAFVNEVAQIFQKLGLSVSDVLEAAATKWNFLPFQPGLVGGHCIGVDPFFLAHCAQEIGHHPEIILAGRRINDEMAHFVADQIHKELSRDGNGSGVDILVLGLTFKENVPDLRNSKVIDVVRRLGGYGHRVAVHDPLADPEEAKRLYGVDLHQGSGVSDIEGLGTYECVVGAVSHDVYRSFGAATFARIVAPGGLVADVKEIWRKVDLPPALRRWEM